MGSSQKKHEMLDTLRKLILMDYLPNCNFLAIGHPGVGKTVGQRFTAYERLKKGYSCIYISADQHPIDTVEAMKSFGWDVDRYIEDGKFYLVDCYSWRLATKRPVDPKYSRFIRTVDPKLTFELTALLEEMFKEQSVERVIFDSLNPFALYLGEAFTTKFLDILTARIKEQAIGSFTLTSNILNPSFENRVTSLFDAVLEFKKEEAGGRLQTYMRATKCNFGPIDTNWHKLVVTSTGPILE